jgi:hypothetical protein
MNSILPVRGETMLGVFYYYYYYYGPTTGDASGMLGT